MPNTPTRFVIQGFHGALPPSIKSALDQSFWVLGRDTWFFEGEWNHFVAKLDMKFLAYYRPEVNEWHIYVTPHSTFFAR